MALEIPIHSLVLLSLTAACGRTSIDQNQSGSLNGGTGGSPSGGLVGFTSTRSMSVRRFEHTATLLPDGHVLIAGGSDEVGGVSSVSIVEGAELYDPASGRFRSTGAMVVARKAHTATLLPSGKVLIVGGVGDPGALSQAELYDPKSGKFTATGSMATARHAHQATALDNGIVLVTGGYSEMEDTDIAGQAELYDPAKGEWSTTGAMLAPSVDHTATLLPNQMVLILGGRNSGYYARAELYDPATAVFAQAGSMVRQRWVHAATLLSEGNVLITGGWGGEPVPSYLASAELFDPSSEAFVQVSGMGAGKGGHTATLLPGGKVLITGGWGGDHNSSCLTNAELYDPTGKSFDITRSMSVGRVNHTATLLQDGRVLVVGGRDLEKVHASAELYH